MRCIVKTWADRLIQTFASPINVKVSHHVIPIAHLPESFHGFRIVQISDLHIDRWNTPVVEASIDMVNALKPDLLVCTGDMIADGGEYLSDVSHILGQLNAHHGKLACLGNHDYSDGHGSFGVRKALTRGGFDLLVNESTELTLHNQSIHLAGADDLILGKQCLHTTTRRLMPEKSTILLSHNPHNFAAMSHFKPDLILSGHTHGGQIPVPSGVYRHVFGSNYVAGMYRMKNSQLYVNRGLGAAVFVHHMGGIRLSIPTPRWFVEPEVSVFTLVHPKRQDCIKIKALYREALAS